ncbi:ATP-binding protein [Pseudonocardia xinjiangensis]|uniref:ATP-binding protein n=1 Tax=Pseudonocardia xinjiangensis TaxID=75289 RepID=UPI003D91F418
MSDAEPLIISLQAAVAAMPQDRSLRLHLAELLVEGDRPHDALPHITHLLGADPADQHALALLARVTNLLVGTAPAATEAASPGPVERSSGGDAFDWSAAEAEVRDLAPPMFIDGSSDGPDEPDVVERPQVRLADVGGMQQVKDRLEAAFLAPMRNPELRRLYGKSLRGGLLLYGPPGCGKTFLARAVAGELGAAFFTVSLADVLDIFIGASERNLADVFRTVRANTPCVLFLDEVDALAQKRSQVRGSAMRGTVNQLLTELDDVLGSNDGVFVLAATNAPWDVDPAVRRPGRLDRMLLVLPPDASAREAILRYHLRDRPLSGIDLAKIVKRTDGFSGADLAHLCESAAETALLDSVRSGEMRMIDQRDIDRALKVVQPSTGAWLQEARNVAQFSNASGDYDDLVAYLRRRKML